MKYFKVLVIFIILSCGNKHKKIVLEMHGDTVLIPNGYYKSMNIYKGQIISMNGDTLVFPNKWRVFYWDVDTVHRGQGYKVDVDTVDFGFIDDFRRTDSTDSLRDTLKLIYGYGDGLPIKGMPKAKPGDILIGTADTTKKSIKNPQP
jgi:hypothetical protein